MQISDGKVLRETLVKLKNAVTTCISKYLSQQDAEEQEMLMYSDEWCDTGRY